MNIVKESKHSFKKKILINGRSIKLNIIIGGKLKFDEKLVENFIFNVFERILKKMSDLSQTTKLSFIQIKIINIHSLLTVESKSSSNIIVEIQKKYLENEFEQNKFEDLENNLIHEFTHYIDRKGIKKNNNIFKRYLIMFKNKSLKQSKIENEYYLFLNKYFELSGASNLETINNLFNLIRVEGLASFNQNYQLHLLKFKESKGAREVFNKIYDKKSVELVNPNFYYEIGDFIFILIGYYYVFSILQCGEFYENMKKNNLISGVIQKIKLEHNSCKLENELHFETKLLLVDEFKNFSVNNMITEYEEACKFFRIKKKDRVIDRKLFTKLRKKVN